MSRAGDADPSFRRAFGIAAVLLAMTYLIFSGVFSYLSPMGGWVNQIFGQPAWNEWDPGSAYVDSAHQLTWGQGQLFEGHPGIGLILLLSAVQNAYYTIAGSGTGFSFGEFTARNLPTVFVLSKLMMTVLHLVASVATFLLARRILRDERAAAFAAFGYATTLNVGYYLSRISVEPIVVICFVFSLLAVWRYQDSALKERLIPALSFAALSASLAVTGAVTKFNFLAPLAPFLALYILLGGWREKNEHLVPWRTRALGLLVFVGTTIAVTLCYSQLIDWGSFFRLWILFTGDHPPINWELAKLLPSFTPGGIFPLSEFLYIMLGVVGWATFLRANSQQNMRVLWLTAYGVWGLLLFGYRMSSIGTFLGFHYFHVTNVVVSVFFGYAVSVALRRLPLPNTGWRAAGFGLLGIIVIHSLMFWTVIDSRIRDAALYAPNREIHDVIAQLSPEQRLGCIECGRYQNQKKYDMFPYFFPLSAAGWTTGFNPEAESRLAGEYASIFVPAQRGRFRARIRVPALQAVVMVLDGPFEETGPSPIEPQGAEGQ